MAFVTCLLAGVTWARDVEDAAADPSARGRWNLHAGAGFSGGYGGPGLGVDASWYGRERVGLHLGVGISLPPRLPASLLLPPTTIGLASQISRRTSVEFDFHPAWGRVGLHSFEVTWTLVVEPSLDKPEPAIRVGFWFPGTAAIADENRDSLGVAEAFLSIPIPVVSCVVRF